MITDYQDVVVWTTDLGSGEPLANVEIDLQGHNTTLTADDDGLAQTSISNHFGWIVATLDDDQAISPANVLPWSRTDQLIWYTVDDRGVYRPGETLHLKGWVRNLDLSGEGDLEFLAPQQLISYRVYDSFGNELGDDSVPP